MLKYLDYNKKNSLNNIKIILNKRKSMQKNKASVVRKIISNVKKNGDTAIIKYEKQFSKITTGRFSNGRNQEPDLHGHFFPSRGVDVSRPELIDQACGYAH